MSTICRALGAMALALSATLAFAQDAVLKPFVLASTGPGDLAQTLDATKAALTKAGFTVAGSYSPYAGAAAIGATNAELRSTAAKSEHGGFGAVVRVSVTKVKDQVQVSYTNPPYMANAYRMAGELKDTAAKLQAALGRIEEFGAEGLTPAKLRKYHYTFAMEYFDEPNPRGSHPQRRRGAEGGRGRTGRRQAGRDQGLSRRCRRQERDAVRGGDEPRWR